MSWNGVGAFTRIFSWVADKNAGLNISSSRMDTDSNDIASNGFGNCLTRDGQGFATANLPMSNFRHTGVGNGVARSDYAAMGQAQDGLLFWSTAGGTADALTVTLTPAITAYADGQLIHARAGFANATTTPTLAVNGLTARTIVKHGGAALAAGDIAGNLAQCIFRYDLANTRWELLNPHIQGNVTGAASSTTGHVVTFADATGKVLADSGVAAVGGANSITPFMFANAAVGYVLGMLNGTLVASVAGSALTIAVKTLAGTDPSATNPVFFLIPDPSAGYVVIEQTAALSITVPSAATLGTVNAQANRIWVGVFNNAGVAVLGVYNSLGFFAGGQFITPWDETSQPATTAISGTSNSAATWYTTGAITKSFRIIGYVESTQATAGTWATSPSKVMLFGPGVKKPGDTVQEVSSFISGSASTTSATFVALTSQNITISMQSAANVARVEASSTLEVAQATNNFSTVRLSRGVVANTNLFGSAPLIGSNTVNVMLFGPVALLGYDIPNTSGNVTYAVQGNVTGGQTLTFGGNTQMAAREIQI